jgi:hypothetical protein
MPYRVAPTALLLAASTLLTGGSLQLPQNPENPPVTVHEWGTFTSVAGEDGKAMQWLPRQAPAELPCFVERLRVNLKGYLPATIRMETPVLYFYSPAQTSVDVDVRFRQGAFTEWYPTARVTPNELDLRAYRSPDFEGLLSWSGVTIAPGASADFRTEAGQSHYYQARETDAAPLRVGSQTERFLFYRGVGLFPAPIEATFDSNGRVSAKSSTGLPMGALVLFENHNGDMAYRVAHATATQLTLDLPDLDETPANPAKVLEDLLVDQGLYRQEAAAMVNTWRDSWLEEGTRLFYFMPPAKVDEILPLRIQPAPASIVRVFIGRVELATAAAMDDLQTAIMAADTAAMRKYGRFLQPFADRVLARVDAGQRSALEQRLRDQFSTMWSPPGAAACN